MGSHRPNITFPNASGGNRVFCRDERVDPLNELFDITPEMAGLLAVLRS